MALISMAVHDTDENKKTECTKRTLDCLSETVDWSRHRIYIIDNGSCDATKSAINYFKRMVINSAQVITLPENIGTAKAVNLGWKQRNAGEHCIKMDNDVVIHYSDWIEEMETAIERLPLIGICGLKRKDCWENPDHPDNQYKSELILLPHKAGERWMVAEKAKHIIGTCQMYNSNLLDKIGYLFQYGLYGYDDVLASYRSNIAGFINVFLPHIEIDHIDNGDTPYQEWKERHAGQYTQDVIKLVDKYISGETSIYYEG